MIIRAMLLSAILLASHIPISFAADLFTVPAKVDALLTKYCVECHGRDASEGGVSFAGISKLEPTARLTLLGKAEEQIAFGLMPPQDAEQPNEAQRNVIADWAAVELRKQNAPTVEDKLRLPNYGNRVEHAKLFSGEIKSKPFTPARRWLVSPQIFKERLYESLQLHDKEKINLRPRKLGAVNVPFILPERSGVRDYDLTSLDGGHFVTMQSNAAWLADKLIGSVRIRLGESREKVAAVPSDRWFPPNLGTDGRQPLMPAFEKIVAHPGTPSDEELAAAIQFHFQRVLQRRATDSELTNYLQLTRKAIELGGNVEGLRKMLVAVYLESEFVYRLEFGEGEPDEHGRRLLSPREASYAIAYALGDQAPDAILVKAAEEGRLVTAADYQREVQRLLADEKQFAGLIDTTLFEIYPSYEKFNLSTHPKIVRFFREFFGYHQALRVFKDRERSDGYYLNPDRGNQRTPGHLVREADLLVETCVREDQNVFEKLLTTERYYVVPRNKASETIDKLNEVYDRFKDTKWQLDPKLDKRSPPPPLPDDDLAFIRKRLNYNSNSRDLATAMTHVEHYRKKNLTVHPQWSYPFGIHELTPHARSYNIDPPEWDYPREQPFQVAQRKGILTHPAWLIAHSQNSATDPIRRGKWIREKLLAGTIPDVPITVDAQIPEHPDKTLRQRLEDVTSKQECWKCHRDMNPLGLAFEMYDDFGRLRTEEKLEHPANIIQVSKTKYGADTYKTAPLVTTGRLDGSGKPELDGDVRDALDLIDRLAKSDRVRQSIIRHAFRFYLGRNEMLSDSQTLIAADKAYVKSGGSFKAVIVSLLTSDSFRYRK